MMFTNVTSSMTDPGTTARSSFGMSSTISTRYMHPVERDASDSGSDASAGGSSGDGDCPCPSGYPCLGPCPMSSPSSPHVSGGMKASTVSDSAAPAPVPSLGLPAALDAASHSLDPPQVTPPPAPAPAGSKAPAPVLSTLRAVQAQSNTPRGTHSTSAVGSGSSGSSDGSHVFSSSSVPAVDWAGEYKKHLLHLKSKQAAAQQK